MNSKIFFLRSSDVGLSVTTTKEGLFDEALIKPQEPSSKENLTPLTVKTSEIICPSILVLSLSCEKIDWYRLWASENRNCHRLG